MHIEDERMTCLYKLTFVHDSLNSSQSMNNESLKFLRRIGEMKTKQGWVESGGEFLS